MRGPSAAQAASSQGWGIGPSGNDNYPGHCCRQSREIRMEKVPIRKIAVLPDGRLAVYPESISDWYEYIYREASGVYWDKENGCFHSTIPREWSYKQWYRQIVSVVGKGLGVRLYITNQTTYAPKDDKFRSDMAAANDDVQRWMSENITQKS